MTTDLSQLLNRTARQWVAVNQENDLTVTTKEDITKRLYHGRCPILASPRFYKKNLPPARFPHSMKANEIDALIGATGIKPRSLLEIGSFWGDTAIRFSKHLDIPVLCMDTWLGDMAMWKNPPPKGFLYRDKEIPPASKFFNQFAANVKHAGAVDRITSMRLPSPTGLRLLISKGLKFDAVYVDGSHDYADVLMDIALSCQVLTKDGFLFGDDVHMPNVKDAVEDFCSTTGSQFDLLRSQTDKVRALWLIKSPSLG